MKRAFALSAIRAGFRFQSMIPDDPSIEELKSILREFTLEEVSLGRCRALCAASGRQWDFNVDKQYMQLVGEGRGYYDYEINGSGRGELIFKTVKLTGEVEIVFGEEPTEPDQAVEL